MSRRMELLFVFWRLIQGISILVLVGSVLGIWNIVPLLAIRTSLLLMIIKSSLGKTWILAFLIAYSFFNLFILGMFWIFFCLKDGVIIVILTGLLCLFVPIIDLIWSIYAIYHIRQE